MVPNDERRITSVTEALQIPSKRRLVAPIVAFDEAMFCIKNHVHFKSKPVGLYIMQKLYDTLAKSFQW